MRATRAMVVAGVFLLALAFGAHVAVREREFERRAIAAEQFARAQQQLAQIANDRADSLTAVAVRVDTVARERIRIVRVTDSISPPPDTCRSYLELRDAAIAALVEEVDALAGALEARTAAELAQRARADTLAAALASRPKGPRFSIAPEIGLGAALGVDGAITPGLTLTIARFRL